MNKLTPDQIADESLLMKIAVFALRLGRKCMSDYARCSCAIRIKYLGFAMGGQNDNEVLRVSEHET